MDVFIKKFIIDIVDDIILIWLTSVFALITAIFSAVNGANTVLMILGLITASGFGVAVFSAFKTIKRYRRDLNLQREMETHIRKKDTVEAKS